MRKDRVKISIRDLSFSYDGREVLRHASLDVMENTITAIIGPSGSGKSTFLLTLNRLWEEMPGGRLQGEVLIRFAGGMEDIYRRQCSITGLRRKVGMVFQTPNPLPMSIFDNVALPLKLAGSRDDRANRGQVRESLRMVGLWDEVRDRMESSAFDLSGGQQQRLCIARALVLQPDILLLDEPTSSLDSRAASVIEELLVELKQRCTILMVSHYFDQVQRTADEVVAMEKGKLVPWNGEKGAAP